MDIIEPVRNPWNIVPAIFCVQPVNYRTTAPASSLPLRLPVVIIFGSISSFSPFGLPFFFFRAEGPHWPFSIIHESHLPQTPTHQPTNLPTSRRMTPNRLSGAGFVSLGPDGG